MATSQTVGDRIGQASLWVLYAYTAWSAAFYFDLTRTDLLAPIRSFIDPSLSPLNLVLPILFLVGFMKKYVQGSRWIHDTFRFLRAGFFYTLILIPLGFTLWYLDASEILKWHTVFLTLTVLKGLKILVDAFSYLVLSVDTIQLAAATVLPRHVTVIIPTIGQLDQNFQEYVESIYSNCPGKIIISTKGLDRLIRAKRLAKEINEKHFDEGRVIAMAMYDPNKRAHFIKAANVSKTRIIAHVEDHVIWPENFLRHALAPFEDRQVGLVGTVTSSNRDYTGGVGASIRNYIACLRIEQENFENTASYNIDGGVFNISGRTSLIRTEIIHSIAFRQGFLDERFHLPLSSLLSWIPFIGGWLGQKTPPMISGNDNFITRYVVNQGYKTVFLNPSNDEVRVAEAHTRDAIKNQIRSWARTEQRHTITSLFVDRTIWYAHPWTTLTVFLPRLFPFNIIFDPLLIIALYLSSRNVRITTIGLGALYLTKLIKAMLLFNRVGGWFWGTLYFLVSPILGLYEAFYILSASFGIFNIRLMRRDLAVRWLNVYSKPVPYPSYMRAGTQSVAHSVADVDVLDEHSQDMVIEEQLYRNVEHAPPVTVQSASDSDYDEDVIDENSQDMVIEEHLYRNVEYAPPATAESVTQSDDGKDVIDDMTIDDFYIGDFHGSEDSPLASPELEGRMVMDPPIGRWKAVGQKIHKLDTAIAEAPWKISVAISTWVLSNILKIWRFLKHVYRMLDLTYRFLGQVWGHTRLKEGP